MGSEGLNEFSRIEEREGGLKRSLSARQLSMIAIGGAIGTGLFLGSSFAIGAAGPAVLVSYLIGAFIVLLLMGCMAEMTVAHPVSGSFGAWAEYYVSPLAGFLVRVVYWAGVVFALGTEISAVAVYMRFWFPAVPGAVWICGFALVLLVVNASNVKYFGSVEYGLSMLKIAAIVAFLILGTWLLSSTHEHPAITSEAAMGWRNYTAFGGFFPKGMGGMWVAVLISLFSYFSIEMIAVAAAEAQDPRVAIRHAFRATMLRLVVFYLCTLALVLAIVPWTVTASGETQSPFVTVMQRTGIPHAAGVVNFVILIAALSAMNSQMYITARMLFSLSRSGFAPKAFGKLSTSGVPVAALMASCVGIGIAAVLNALYREHAFLLMLACSMFGPLFTWFMVFVTHLRFRVGHREPLPFKMWGYPYTTLIGAVLMLAATVTTAFVPAFRLTLIYGVPFLVIMSLLYAARAKQKSVSLLRLRGTRTRVDEKRSDGNI